MANLQQLQSTYAEWDASQRDKEGYRPAKLLEECRACGAKSRVAGFSSRTNYSILIPQEQKSPGPADYHILEYDGIGYLCLSCAEALPLQGLNATRRGQLLHSRDMGTLY